ncbi:lipoate--protein ligase [Mesomycoplasma molare]|uniref:lipoate--protein ligase n=1 Tax=Mesomycoplasma molare TaxID=171288 RepID=A0ABY5TVD2_9BACT|nr:lipoate--protein ligase [Mesomycoplasma molare]UWD34195.1 lipoate--protein ligase [Mesomycoplasma molare]
MKIYISKNYSPFFNLVLEEIMAKDENNNEDIIFIYQHSNAIIIGRNQNAFKEVKLDILKEEKIELYRRLSGGGAVFHDLGNINFSFITKKDEMGYQKFLKPVLEFLKTLNLNAEFKGRNDLMINGAKFSGNAQFIHKDKIVHHGTMLFDANLSKLAKVLNPSKLKIQSKGIESIRQRVTNLINELETKITVDEFINKFAIFLEQKYDAKILEIPNQYINEIEKLATLRSSEDWIFGKNPEFSIFNEEKTAGGILQISSEIKENKIQNIKFEGDFLSKLNTGEISNLLIGHNFNKESVEYVLQSIKNINDYFGNITIEEILKVMFG